MPRQAVDRVAIRPFLPFVLGTVAARVVAGRMRRGAVGEQFDQGRAAIGARIKVTLETPHGVREIHRVVSNGGSFGGNPLRQEIGLGDATAITLVQIQWPGSYLHQLVSGLEMNQSYEIREGSNQFVRLPLHPVDIRHEGPIKKSTMFGSKN